MGVKDQRIKPNGDALLIKFVVKKRRLLFGAVGADRTKETPRVKAGANQGPTPKPTSGAADTALTQLPTSQTWRVTQSSQPPLVTVPTMVSGAGGT